MNELLTNMNIHRTVLLLLLAGIVACKQVAATSSCPWAQYVVELESSCICDYNLAKELSVQCDIVDYEQLLAALRRYASKSNVDLFYVNNSTIGTLRNNSLTTVKINNIQLSGCQIKTIEPDAFKGQENSLKSLNLKDNELTEIPSSTLKTLRNLTVLDLSMNKITRVNDNAFAGLKLVTLKLSDNEVNLAPGAFRGLERSLKNLNLKGTRQKKVPEALKGLRTLAFLDLSQNSIRELPGSAGTKAFEGLESLTGLNLERNLIQNIGPDAFHGIKHTLSSLSLLNNLIPDFPTAAINSIQDLRVLDIGFNLITELPVNAFEKNPSITLLAIDGNPLSTVPEEALARLNGTLRGLSLGGRFLVCDCKLRWIVDWIKTRDLQVTSRERKPQFCGSPQKLQDKSFYNIDSEEMTCERTPEIIGIGTVESVDTREPTGSVEAASSLNPTIRSTISIPTTTTTTTTVSTTMVSPTTEQPKTETLSTTTARSITNRPTAARTGNVVIMRTTPSPSKHSQDHLQQHQPRPPLVLGSPLYKSKSTEKNIIVKDVLRQDNAVSIYWDTEATNILGFKVIYRLFGDNSFKQAPPLEASEREFKIKNVPSQECIVVCVVSLEETNITPANVPYNQCKEVRTENSPTSNMDKITIAASAAICATIVVAVIIFIVANRRRARKLHTLHSIDQTKMGGPIAGLPVNCCSNVGPTPSPGGPLSSMATLSAYNAQKEWDQVSAYSNRSIPRPRIFPIDRQGSITRASCIDDVRSQTGHYGGKVSTRTVVDGQSQHSFSNTSTRYFGNNMLSSNLANTRSELRQSRQSLAGASDRMSRTNFSPSHMPSHSSARRQRPRSCSRNLEQNPPRPSSRYSIADSTHTLNNYEENNWTDHDMDIYMARNPTTRTGLMPL
ncbi:leucine-rich repeat and fibronectin type-III domain-containing protein hattifattener [Osmia lignaria lignaria]|uniref:leucine-rich repeat and fibronectin type-III domain-containing protein hattifattener n=1 Tax=Osmia lignaria lignaria TaxID=1437193 RepID=UPI0014795C4B|nr:leucine-rich repeat and fibronectin type-III domain-containing protein 5 [Osmia lignaria]XP_034183933.1 leucine-rich repeat and fibronectin type-III domain-containing protein 5 [Osmia lignaria]